MKTLVIYPGSSVHQDSGFSILDPDTGEVLAQHFCSGAFFAKSDLHDRRSERLSEWKEKYGETTEAKFIDETDFSWDEIYKKNQELANKEADS